MLVILFPSKIRTVILFSRILKGEDKRAVRPVHINVDSASGLIGFIKRTILIYFDNIIVLSYVSEAVKVTVKTLIACGSHALSLN